MPKKTSKRIDPILSTLEPPPQAVVNPIVERGFVMAPDEWDLLSNAIAVAAHAARESGGEAAYKRLRQLLGRMSHSVQAPQGLQQEQIDRYRKRAAEGLRERDSGKLAGGVQDLIAATCRTDPDPGDKVAVYLLQLVADLIREHGHMGIELLARLDTELEAAKSEWQGTHWPAASDVLAWIQEIVEIGISNLKAGRDPWPDEGEDQTDVEVLDGSATDA